MYVMFDYIIFNVTMIVWGHGGESGPLEAVSEARPEPVGRGADHAPDLGPARRAGIACFNCMFVYCCYLPFMC